MREAWLTRTGRTLAVVLAVAMAASACGGAQVRGEEANRPRVAIVGLKKVAAVRERVEEIAGRRFEIISEAEYRAAARRLKARKMTRRHVAKVAAHLGAVAVVHARVKKRRRGRQQVTVVVRDGESGKVIESYKLTVRRGTIARSGRRAVDHRLRTAVAPRPPPEPERAGATAAAEAPAPEGPAPEAAPPESDADADRAPDEAGAEEEAPLPPVQVDESGQAI